MRFANVNGHEINADNVDEVRSEHCGVCGWHYNIVVVMSRGNKIIVEDVVWHPEWWGEFQAHNGQRLELGHHHIKERIGAVKKLLTLNPDRRTKPCYPPPIAEGDCTASPYLVDSTATDEPTAPT